MSEEATSDGPDLWGHDFSEHRGTSEPVRLLQAQAAALTRRTQGRVVGRVRERVTSEGTVWVGFWAHVPALGDYQYKLVTISHAIGVRDQERPYPVTVWEDDLSYEVGDREALVGRLASILQSEEMHNVIDGLLRYGSDRAAS